MISTIKAAIRYLRRDEQLAVHVVLGLVAGYILLSVFVWLMKAISWFGSNFGAIASIVLATLAFYLSGARREAGFVLATALSLPVIAGAKLILNRQRPTADLVRVVYEAQFQSFPSGHVTFYTVFFGFIAYLMYRMDTWPIGVRLTVGILSLSLVFTVPFSRVYLGVHWGTDVVAGFFLGLILLIGLLTWYAHRR